MFDYRNYYIYKEPITYMGIEPNFKKKELSSSSFKILFIYPDVYGVAWSSFNFRLVFDFLHKNTNAIVDCLFYPQLDLLEDISAGKINYYSHFYKIVPKDFDLIVTTINYELQLFNFLKLLQLIGIWEKGEGIPLDYEKRPLLMIGGSCAFSNPALFFPFSDIIYAGEIEANGRDIFSWIEKLFPYRKEILKKLNEFEELLIPSLWEDTHTPKRRVFVEDFSSGDYYPRSWIMPVNKIIHDKVYVELMRGCTQGCRFCQAGFIYRPRRERDPRLVEKIAEEYILQTGYEELSLLSLSSNSYTKILPLLEKLYKKLKTKGVNLSLPSLRIDEFKGELKEYLASQRKTSLTFAPEAGNERMRRIINKKITDAEIFKGVEEALKGGWHKLKFYFMIGFPGETPSDVEDIGKLLQEIYFFSKKFNSKVQIHVSVNLFIPKPFTPFQSAQLLDRKEFEERINLIIKHIKKIKKIKMDWSDYDFSLIEALLSRGSSKLKEVIVAFIETASGLFTWREHFDFKKWQESFTKRGGDCYNFYKEYETSLLKEKEFPWEILDIGISKRFLEKEWEAALGEKETADCFKEGKCGGCGLQSFCF